MMTRVKGTTWSSFCWAQHVLVLTRPGDRIARGQVHLLAHQPLGLVHVAAHVPAANVDEGPAVEAGVLALEHGGAVDDLDLGDLAQGDRGLTGQRSQ